MLSQGHSTSNNVPNNTLQQGSIWKKKEGGKESYDGCHAIQAALTENDIKVIGVNAICVERSDSNGKVFKCITGVKGKCPTEGECKKRIKCKYIEATGRSEAMITFINLTHTCENAISSLASAENHKVTGRMRNSKSVVIEHGSSSVYRYYHSSGRSFGRTNESSDLSQMMTLEDAIGMSKQQCLNYIQSLQGGSLSVHLKSLSKLPLYLEHLREIDPEGIYYLATKPLSSTFKGSDKLQNDREFELYIMLPSASINFFNHSRKMSQVAESSLRVVYQ